MKTKKTRSDYLHKELKFKHEGKEYIVVLRCTQRKLKEAANNATFGCGAHLSAVELFDMTSFREIHK